MPGAIGPRIGRGMTRRCRCFRHGSVTLQIGTELAHTRDGGTPHISVPLAKRTPRSSDGDAGELFDAREAGGYFCDAVVPQRLHAALEGGTLDLFTGRVPRG